MSSGHETLHIITGGAGDTGRRLADLLEQRRTGDVWLTSRAPEKAPAFENARVVTWAGADAAPAFKGLLERAVKMGYERLIVFNVIGAWLSDPEDGILGVAEALAEALPGPFDQVRIVHCSATSVYGDRPGELIDESSRLSPALEVGQIHAEAERRLLGTEDSIEAVILRVPHIYGPGRERTVGLMAEGRFAVAGDGHNIMHHIHVADLARILHAAAFESVGGQIINAVDDGPFTYGDYCDFITSWYGQDPLPRISFEQALNDGVFADYLGPAFRQENVLREFYLYMTSDCRISNARMRAQLDVELAFPNALEGLQHLLQIRDAAVQSG